MVKIMDIQIYLSLLKTDLPEKKSLILDLAYNVFLYRTKLRSRVHNLLNFNRLNIDKNSTKH
ncbi:hypothetical protein BpHYR1_034581 [Brachionus plicatilis]|uniref:Uncharacterized protein n=1 Tax=Brachionus plicatilis TaxID=10195 RepID=A0A3M7R7W1_BRAPC|nr:hypothetical protein BpHYR1_034581 [Brachionus plicatilis]